MDRRWNNKAFYYEDTNYQLELDLQDIRRALVYLLDEPDDEECFICNRLRCRCAEYTLRSFRTTPSDILMDFLLDQNESNSELDYSCISYNETFSDISEFDYVDFAPPPHASSSFEDFDVENEEYNVVENSSGFPIPPPANSLPTPPWDCKTPEEKYDEVRAYYDDLLKWVQVSHPEVNDEGPTMPFPIDESINNEVNLSWPPHLKSIWRNPQPEYSRSNTLFAYYRSYTMRLYDLYQNREMQRYHQFFS